MILPNCDSNADAFNSVYRNASKAALPWFAWLRGIAGILLIAYCLSPAGAHAQSPDSLIVNGKSLLSEGYNQADVGKMKQSVSLFSRVATGSPSRSAYGHYYAAFAYTRIVNIVGNKDEEQALDYLDAAIEHLKKAIEQDAEFADAYALLASAYGRKMGMKPRLGMFLGPESSKLMKKAKSIEPNNPRTVFIQATSDFFTPETWGGSTEKAVDGFERAIELFEQETVTDPIEPSWGHSDAHAWLGYAHMKEGRYEEAESQFERALSINPDYGWVTDVLMPQLNSRKESASAEG
ncbi:MAG: tetratricopeptide repeat protein [Bacteroidetes bacterium]|jgi:tetratricopeptide (TPR) repeat protein|nr:tetratricopeptide repeat protein [Bacteroidota bacterium]